MSIQNLGKKFSVISIGGGSRSARVSVAREPEEAYAEIPTEVCQEDLEAEDEYDQEMNLFEDEQKTLPPMSNWFNKLAAYTGGIEPTVDETKQLRDKQAKRNERKRLGTFLGVFLPCVQNIFGILLFVRVGWITGVAGSLQATVIYSLCCACTMLTALSMSAIATNGKVPAGGSYFMISRSIGPEFGGAVGILFYFGTTIASSMYLVGAIEIFLKYIYPPASLFGDITLDSVLFNNTRVYGTILLLLVMCCVLIGIKFVSRFAAVGLCALVCSITCLYLGVFTISEKRSPYVCSLGGRLLASSFYTVNGTADCSKNTTGPIYHAYCVDPKTATNASCAFFEENPIRYFPAMPGLTSRNFFENFFPSFYREKGQAYDSLAFPPKRELGQSPNIADLTTSFMILLGIYFPSVTGIMAGSNRSGDLANPQYSIPRGTITAIAVTSFAYISAPLFMSAVCEGAVMRDKFGESYGGGLLVAAFAWPHAWVILIGAVLSTIGAGLQCLTGSPRLLQAIAQDNVIPFLRPFKVTTRRGEPLRAQLLSYAIAQVGMLIASIDSLTPLITMFFLMCYGFVNLATTLNGLVKEPSWRPRFRSHWFLSLIGLLLCIALMFISSWYYTIVAWVLAGAIYKYIEYRGASKEWGDATRGLQLSTAMRAILKLGVKPVHAKNWRPQILVFVPADESFHARHHRLLDLAYQLKAAHGLTLVGGILEGDLVERKEDAMKAKLMLDELIHEHRIKGIPEVLVSATVEEGIKNMAQCAGLGNLRHNTIMVSFPEDWRTEMETDHTKLSQFIATIRAAQACDLAMLVPKGIDSFPKSKSIQMQGSVDVWCIVHDGGLLLLTSHLLMRNRVWRKCKLRIFVVASEGDDTVNLKKDMTKFVYDLRINADVDVVAMSTADISAYVTQRTASIEERRQMLQQMKLTYTEARRDPQHIVDQHRKSVTANDYSDSRVNATPLIKQALLEDSPDTPSTPAENTMPAVNANGNPPVSSEPSADQSSSIVTTDLLDHRGQPHHTGVTFATGPGPAALAREQQREDNGELNSFEADGAEKNRTWNEFTFSPSQTGARAVANAAAALGAGKGQQGKRMKTKRRLHSAARLNELLRTHSSEALLVIVNMPNPSRSSGSEYYYMDYIEALTDGLPRVLLVRGTGREVITAFSE